MNEHNLRILGIAGSTRPESFNKMALAVAAEQLPPGSTLQVFDLAGFPMYFQQAEASCPEPVSRLKAAIRSADAVLFATPELLIALAPQKFGSDGSLVDGGGQ